MKRTFMTILTVSLIANFLLAWPMQARGAGFIGTDGDPAADILSQPDKIYSFDPPTITWKMTSQFLQKYSHPKQQEQVRLAIEEWEQASFSAIKRSAPTYGWTRWNGDRDFSDLRSVLTHEIGHAIGSQHPDAVWFNNNLQLNFVPDNGSYIAQAPIGGEIMNEGNTENFLPGQKPPKGLRGGEYWRTVSQDELAFMDHAYPSQIDFIEVGFNDSAELIIDLFNVGGAVGSTLGIGGPDSSELRNPGDVNDGRRILQASAKINDAASRPIGFQASPHNWEVTNTTGEPINALTIKTRGTNNPNPTSWSSQGANAFQFRGTLAPPPVPNPEAFDLEDVKHFYNTPLGGQIANSNTVEVGLRQDVWDWSVVSAQARQTDNDLVNVNLVTVLGWFIMGPVVPNAGDDLPDDITTGDLWEINATFDTLVKGFKVMNNEETATNISELSFAPAPSLLPNPDLLDSDTKDQLGRDGVLEAISLPTPISLAPGEEYFVILEGLVDDLPGEITSSGNFVLLSRPGLMDDQLFVYALSSGADSTVGNYALLNTSVFVPEPASLALMLVGGFSFMGRKVKYRRTAD